MTIEYRLGKINVVVNTLTKKVQLETLEEEDLPVLGDIQIHFVEMLQRRTCEGF